MSLAENLIIDTVEKQFKCRTRLYVTERLCGLCSNGVNLEGLLIRSGFLSSSEGMRPRGGLVGWIGSDKAPGGRGQTGNRFQGWETYLLTTCGQLQKSLVLSGSISSGNL